MFLDYDLDMLVLRASVAVLLASCQGASPPGKSSDTAWSTVPTDTGLPQPPDTDSPADTHDTGAPPDTASPSSDPGDTPDEARPLPSPEPALQVSDAIDPAGDIDWYSVELSAGDTLWIAILSELRSPPSPLSPRLEVHGPGGDAQVARGMPLAIGGDNTALAYEATESGVHLIQVEAGTPHSASLAADPTLGSPNHTYSLRLERSVPFESEPDNDTPEQLTDWLEEDGHYGYLGDPFIAGYPLFSGRADRSEDLDLFPWTVRGELADGTPADWELWSWSPWPGSSPVADWTVTSRTDDGTETFLGQTGTPTTDPLWRIARRNLPLLPDVGLLVAPSPSDMWLEVAHPVDAGSVGTAYTGIVAGWYTDAIDREAELPTDLDEARTPTVHAEADRSLTALWGVLEDHESSDRYVIAVDSERPWLQVFVQAQGVGSALDPSLSIVADGVLVDAAHTSPLDGGADPELLDVDASTLTSVMVVVEADGPNGGAYLLQIHATAAPEFL